MLPKQKRAVTRKDHLDGVCLDFLVAMQAFGHSDILTCYFPLGCYNCNEKSENAVLLGR